MNKIPTTSQITLLKGFWFIFRDGNREIVAHGSVWTGLERIFINSKLISEKRTLGKTSNHQFIFETNKYEVIFYTPNPLTVKIECSLIKDGVRIGYFKSSYKYKVKITDFIVFLLLDYICGYLQLPVWAFIIVNICYALNITDREIRKIVINKVEI